MVHNIIWKADCHSAYQKVSYFLYGTWRFITIFTKARHWTLPWASWIQFAPSIWVACHHGMACPQVADRGDGLLIWRIAANVLNKQPRTADNRWFSSLGVGRGANNSPLKTACYEML